MKLMCKLFGHKTKEEHQYRHSCYLYCYRCKENVFVTAPKNPKVCQCQWCVKNKFNRSDLDESENVIIDEDRINYLWNRCLKSNSYTHMGSEIRFDKIADMVIGENQWHMRDQAMTTIKAMGKLLSPEKKLEIIKASGVSKSDINSCYGEE